jgi:hypothetical protein
MVMRETRRSVPALAGISVLAIGLAASPIALDLHPIDLGANLALAQGGGGGGGGGGGRESGRGSRQGMGQGMGMQQGAMSQSGMTERMQTQMMNRETIRSVQRRLNQLGYQAGPEDGMMGPQTHRAISAYQNRMGMQPNGVLTPGMVDEMMGPMGKSAN